MSECAGPTTISKPGQYKRGTVGRPILGSEVKIAEDGEILIRGQHVFSGYLHSAEVTREVLGADGWLRTGDIGEFDEEGYLAITGRKKNILITAGGENIAPEMLENKLNSVSCVEHAVVIGDKKKYLTSLLTINWDLAQLELKSINSKAKTLKEACHCSRFQELIHDRIVKLNKTVARVQTIKKFKLLPTIFSENSGELTPTMKIKRQVIVAKYQKEIDSMYQ